MNVKGALYDWGGLNAWLFHAVNDWRGGVVDRVAWAGTQIGDHSLFPLYLALFTALALFSVRRADEVARQQSDSLARHWLETLGVLSVAYLVDAAFLTWAKAWYGYPRPLLALPAASVHVVGTPEYFHGLPSGHASFAMLIAAAIWPMLGMRGRVCAAIFVLWVGIARVNVGAHFPADVLAAWLTALVVVLLIRAVLRRLFFSESRSAATSSI
jgi:membrane-associated phospholipid phosphatase